jgi:hypothetical protein
VPLKSLAFDWVKFRPEVILGAMATYEEFLPVEFRAGLGTDRSVDLISGVHWEHDTDEEFFSDYRQPCTYAMWRSLRAEPFHLLIQFYGDIGKKARTAVTVRLPERYQVEQVLEVFESRSGESLIARPRPPRPRIFIGHGHSNSWRELSDHLRDQQNFDVVAFESEPRAGRVAKDVLSGMASRASFALLVHTAEDEQADSSKRARQNVIHETGFFQGRLGFEKAIILREEGCESLTNLDGVQEIPYLAGRIRETFGDVVATIRREFPDA